MAKSIVKRSKRKSASGIDPHILALGAGVGGAIAGRAVARKRANNQINAMRNVPADTVRSMRKAISANPSQREWRSQTAIDRALLKDRKASVGNIGKSGMNLMKSSRFDMGAAEGALARNARNYTAAERSVKMGEQNLASSSEQLAKAKANTRAMAKFDMSTVAAEKKRFTQKAVSSAGRRGAARGAIGAASIAMIVAQVMKELNKK